MSLARVQSLSKPLGLRTRIMELYKKIRSTLSRRKLLHCFEKHEVIVHVSFVSESPDRDELGLSLLHSSFPLECLRARLQTTLLEVLSLYGVFEQRERLVSSLPHSTMLHLQVFSTSWRFFPPMLFRPCFIPNPPLRFCFQGVPPFRSRHSSRRALPLEQNERTCRSVCSWE
jgi:hypothetical protein